MEELKEDIIKRMKRYSSLYDIAKEEQSIPHMDYYRKCIYKLNKCLNIINE